MTFDRAESAKTVETREGSASTLSDGLWTGKSASPELMADATPQAREQQGIRFDPKSPDLTPGGGPAEVEKNNVERLTEQLGKKIFEKAADAHNGDYISINADGNTKAFIDVTSKGKPEPVKLEGTGTTVTPSMNEGAFELLVLNGALTRARAGEYPHPIPIKLALPNGEELSGNLVLRVPLKR